MSLRRPLLGMLSVLLLLCCAVAAAAAESSPRQRLTFDLGWKFSLGDTPGAEAPAFADTAWRPLDLPHDFSIEGPFDAKNPSKGSGGFAPLGVGWYRKTFRAPAGAKGKLISAEFDGVMFQADVWLNGHKVGHNDYGYIGFACDLTPYIIEGGDNVLAVRADNTKQASRWYTGSGIYRHVWLSVTDPVRVARDGVAIATRLKPGNQAEVEIHFTVKAETKDQLVDRFSPDVRITEPNGKVISGTYYKITRSREIDFLCSCIIPIENPKLWTPESPSLYRAEILLKNKHAGVPPIADLVEVPFGIRDAKFDPDHGFILNGQRTILKGVCLHLDLGALGAAAFDRAIERRLEILKSMGVNALRLSHNPYSPEMLDLADRMGFIVFDEAFDKWKGFKNDGTGWKDDLRAFIERDRNHPSVVIWSVGNEVSQQGTDEGAYLYQAMRIFVETLDPTRPVTVAFHPGNPAPKHVLPKMAQFMDVAGLNYQTEAYDQHHAEFPKLAILGTESLPAYTFNLRERDPKEGMKTYPGNPWFAVKDYVAGQFIWAGIAYLGESKGWSSKGWPTCPIDTAGFPNPNFYVQQSNYSEKPMVRLAVDDPTWWQTPMRLGWAWPGMAEHWNWATRGAAPLKVYTPTNAEAVELILNGKSLGEKKAADFLDRIPVWEVPFAPGTLQAVARRGGVALARFELKTAGAPARLELVPDRTGLRADGQDLLHVEVRVVDQDGTLVPDARNLVRFEVTGTAALAGVDNGDMTDTASYQAAQRETRRGRALAIVRAGRQAGKLTLTAPRRRPPRSATDCHSQVGRP